MKIRSLLLLCALLAVALALVLRPPGALVKDQDNRMQPEAPNEAALNAPLSSLLVRDEEVFAANAHGVFRATREHKQWSRLPTPKHMPAGGVFADVPRNVNYILYYSPTFPIDRFGPRCGLYGSADDGRTWHLISSSHAFQHVLLHSDGSLYAIVLRAERMKEGINKDAGNTGNVVDLPWRIEGAKESAFLCWRILRAPAIAVPPEWVDITGEIWAGMSLHGIFEDPNHPGLVCLTGNCGRGYVIHAKDKNYRWEMTREWEWRKEPETDESFFRQHYRTQATLYMLSATLANYFQHPFGSATKLDGLTLRAKQANFTFAKDQPKVVPVAIHFLQEEDSARLLDLREDVGFWGIRVVTPSGERAYRGTQGPLIKKKEQQVREAFRERKDLVTVEVKKGKPYERSIDLGRLFEFSQVGAYKEV